MSLNIIHEYFTTAHYRYCDILHRASLHLGGWARLEGRSAHAPYNPWSNSVLWPQGALVKHNRELYRAEGITNAAEPGNTTHARLHVCIIFSYPLHRLKEVVRAFHYESH